MTPDKRMFFLVPTPFFAVVSVKKVTHTSLRRLDVVVVVVVVFDADQTSFKIESSFKHLSRKKKNPKSFSRSSIEIVPKYGQCDQVG